MPLVGALLLALGVGVVLSAVARALRSIGEGRDSVVAGATLAVLCVLPERVARLTGSLASGLAVVVLAAAIVTILPLPRPPLHSAGPRWSRASRWTALLVGAALTFVVWTTWLWDESSTHLPLAGALARDVFPLEHPLWPAQPVRYHIGFPVLGALVRATTGLPLDLALDVASTACLVALLWLLHDAGVAIAGPRAGALTIVVVLFADGPLAALLADGWGLLGIGAVGRALLPGAWVDGSVFPPMVVTNFFQHPQGLAMPIALAAILVATGARTLPRFAIAAAILVCCAQAQVVFFALLGVVLSLLGVTASIAERDLRRAAARLGILVVAAAVALALGGLLDPSTAGAQIRFGAGAFGAVSVDNAGALVTRNLLAFGTSLLAPLVALVVVARGDLPGDRRDIVVACAVAALGGYVVGNVAHYERSWDIVKFLGVGGFFGNLVLVPLLLCPRWPRGVVASVVVVACWSGVLWWARYGPLNGVAAPLSRGAGTGHHVESFAAAFGEVIGPKDRVWTASFDLARAGFLVPGSDWRQHKDARALLLDRRRVDDDVHAWRQAQKAMDTGALARLGVRFVALTAREHAALAPAARAALDDPARFDRVRAPGGNDGGWRVWRVRGAP